MDLTGLGSFFSSTLVNTVLFFLGIMFVANRF